MINYSLLIFKRIPFATFLAASIYFFTYFFQFGYAYQLGFPTEYVEVDFNVMLRTAGSALLIAMLLGYSFNALVITTGYFRSLLVVMFIYSVVIIYLFGLVALFNPLRGIFHHEYLVVMLFSMSLAFLCSAINGKSWSKLHDRDYARYIFILATLSGVAGLSGAVYTMTEMREFKTDDGYILLASYGQNLVLGKCTSDSAEFMLVSKEEKIHLMMLDHNSYQIQRECFWSKNR